MRVVKVNGTNRKPFASILYKFLLVVLCAAVCKAADLQMKWLRTLQKFERVTPQTRPHWRNKKEAGVQIQ